MLFHVTALAVIGCKSNTVDKAIAAAFFIMFSPPYIGYFSFILHLTPPPNVNLFPAF